MGVVIVMNFYNVPYIRLDDNPCDIKHNFIKII